MVQVAPRPAALVRELRAQVGGEPVDDPAPPAGVLLAVQDVPPDRPVQRQQLAVRGPRRPDPRRPDPRLELLEQLDVPGRLGHQAAHTHAQASRPSATGRVEVRMLALTDRAARER